MEKVEDVLLNRREDATERLIEFAEGYQAEAKIREKALAWREGSVQGASDSFFGQGITDFIQEDTEAARQLFDRPLEVIEGPLDGMRIVGDLFGEGRCFFHTSGQKRESDEAGCRLSTPFHGARKREKFESSTKS